MNFDAHATGQIRTLTRRIWILRGFLVFETLATAAMLGAVWFYGAQGKWWKMAFFVVPFLVWASAARQTLDMIPKFKALRQAVIMGRDALREIENLLDK